MWTNGTYVVSEGARRGALCGPGCFNNCEPYRTTQRKQERECYRWLNADGTEWKVSGETIPSYTASRVATRSQVFEPSAQKTSA